MTARLLVRSIVLVATTMIAVSQGVALSADQIPGKIGEDVARHLVGQGYGAWSEKWLEPEPYMSDLFFVFDGLNKPPVNGSFGFFAVNRWTGDVWALWGCHKLTSPALRRSQMAIRRCFTGAEMKQYARLRRLKPECIVED